MGGESGERHATASTNTEVVASENFTSELLLSVSQRTCRSNPSRNDTCAFVGADEACGSAGTVVDAFRAISESIPPGVGVVGLVFATIHAVVDVVVVVHAVLVAIAHVDAVDDVFYVIAAAHEGTTESSEDEHRQQLLHPYLLDSPGGQ
jgi:hypothetical protein